MGTQYTSGGGQSLTGAGGVRSRARSTQGGTRGGFVSGPPAVDSMRQFNYFGTSNAMNNQNAYMNPVDSEDVELLEWEIESVIMRKGNTAVGGRRNRLD